MFIEDEHGPEFFKNLIERLKGKKLIPENIVVESKKLPADCNSKLERMIKAALIFGFQKVILILDGDGEPEERKKVAEVHIPSEFKGNVRVVVFQYEAEEWICESLGIPYGGYKGKPSDALKQWLRNKEGRDYNKRDLPKFVHKLDFEKLKDNIAFMNLCEFLKCY